MRSGGGSDDNGELARETPALRRELHRAQCRAARRIHVAQQLVASGAGARCLGALQVYRLHQRQQQPKKEGEEEGNGGSRVVNFLSVEEERLACAQAGRFERFGERDVAFVCDFCDGFLVWDDLRAMPTTRLQQQQPQPQPPARNDDVEPQSATSTTPAVGLERQDNTSASSGGGGDSSGSTTPNWQAHGISMTGGEGKTIVFAPVAVANHLPPDAGAWRSRILCPYCDEYYYEEQGEDDMERVRYAQDDKGFDGVKAFQEHLEWSHASMVPSASSCGVM